MSQLNFGIRIGAQDDTQQTLRGALSGFRSFARTVSQPIIVPLKIGRKGLGLLRDINLGLRPLVTGLDNIIERGTGLEVVRKSFESLTGKGGRQADVLARRMVRAASGTLRLAKAMQIANQALVSGISYKQLLVALDFISKKAATTGKNAEQAINQVVLGLSRGSWRFLDDFGILVDGLDGIEEAYNRIHGAEAFKSLGPAAQKAELVRQAISEMQQQLRSIGVSGKETIFVFQGLKNQIGDAVDKLFMAVGKSKTFEATLKGVRDTIGGVIQHIEKGGGLGDILFGKKGGKSGGLFGFLKAGAMDLGEAVGRGFLGVMLKGLAASVRVFEKAWHWIKGEIFALCRTIKQEFHDIFPWAKPTYEKGKGYAGRAWDEAKEAGKDAWGVIRKGWKTFKQGVPALQDQKRLSLRGVVDTGKTDGAGEVARAERTWIDLLDHLFQLNAWRAKRFLNTLTGAEAFFEATRGYSPYAPTDPRTGLPVAQAPGGMLGLPGSNPLFMAMFGAQASAIGMAQDEGLSCLQRIAKTLDRLGDQALGGGPSRIGGALGALADRLLGGGSWADWSRVRQWRKGFREDFPPKSVKDVDTTPVDPAKYPLTIFGKQRLRRDISQLDREIRLIEGGGRDVRREALRRTGEQVAHLRREKRRVSPQARQAIFEQIMQELIAGLTKDLRRQRAGLKEKLEAAEQREFLNLKAARERRWLRHPGEKELYYERRRRRGERWGERREARQKAREAREAAREAGIEGDVGGAEAKAPTRVDDKQAKAADDTTAAAQRMTEAADQFTGLPERLEQIASNAEAAYENSLRRQAEYARRSAEAAERSAAASKRFDDAAEKLAAELSGADQELASTGRGR